MFIEALFIVAPNWKLPKCPSTNEWINPSWYINAMEYYSAIERSELLIHATIWINLKIILLGKRSQIQKYTYYMIPFT